MVVETNRREIMNLMDTSLLSLAEKGNLGYAEELYNPLDYFTCVHHLSYYKEDKNIKLSNPTIKVHAFNPFSYLINLPILAMRNRICLIRGRGPYHASLVGLVVGKLLGIPFVVSIGGNHRLANELRGYYPIPHSKFLSEKEEELVLRNADMVICPNRYSRDYVVGLGVKSEKTSVIPLRLKDDYFHFSYQPSSILVDNGVDIKRPIILFIGRFAGDKQADVLIDAIPLVAKECPKAQFVLIGGGKSADIKQRVKELGQEDHTYFLGFQPTEIVKYCLSVASVVVVPMSGFVIYEAAATSKAIIAFDVEWHSEFIENEQTGLLVENRNCVALAGAIERLIRNPQLAEVLGRNARNAIDIGYNPKDLAQKEIEALMGV